MTTPPTPVHPAAIPWQAVEGEPHLLDALEVTGAGPQLPSAHHVTELVTGAIGAATLAATALWHDRGGPTPEATIDRTHAALASRSERYTLHANRPRGEQWAPLSGDYRAADRWVRIHANFDHHRDAALRTLGLPEGEATPREIVAASVATRAAEQLIDDIKANGGAASSWRTAAEWRSHPQGRALDAQPLIALTSMTTDTSSRPLAPASRPLEGIRVLDLSRVLAGPIAGRFLASYGAQVLRISAPYLPTFPDADNDTGFGKRSAFVDLRTEAGRATLRGLIEQADVFLQAYRPGALVALGFAPDELAELNPNLVTVHLSAYGHTGPWQEHRGFDSLVQMASGIVAAETAASSPDAPDARPTSLPAQALDHATGYLAALGAIAGLRRRHRGEAGEAGGGTFVQLSLARTGHWLQDLGPADHLDTPEPDPTPYLHTTGDYTHLRPAGVIPASPPRYDTPPPEMGDHHARWW